MIENFAFNYDSIVQQEIEKIIKTFSIKTVVETGTYVGHSTAFFSKCGCNVHTIEVNSKFYNSSVENLKNYENVKCYLGSSIGVLPSILDSLDKNLTLFYLDAHWEDNWPLLEEIKMIGNLFKDNCIIIIDDFVVPNRKLQYDIYKNIKNDINFISPILNETFTDYIYYYNDKSNHNGSLYMNDCYGVGKIYIFPKNILENKKDNFFININDENYSIL